MNDTDLLLAAGRGDHRAFGLLMERHVPFAMTLALRMTGNLADAEEVAQDAFLRVWTHAGRWRDDGGALFTTWLYRVVLNLCLDRRRKPVALPIEAAGDIPDAKPGALEAGRALESRTLVAEALRTLPDRQRMAVSLCYFGDLGYREAAEIMDITPGAVESLLVRGRRGLRDHLRAKGLTEPGDLL